MTLNKHRKSKSPCFAPDLRKKLFSFLPLSQRLAEVCLFVCFVDAIIQLRKFLSSSNSLGVFIMKGY